MAKDKFAQIAYIQVVESAANTLTFNGLSVFSNVLSNRGMLLHRVEYTMGGDEWAKILGASDGVLMGISGDDSLTAVSISDEAVYDYKMFQLKEHGAPANAIINHDPQVTFYHDLPGGGKLVPADRLYGYIQGASLASALTLNVRIYFTLLDMTASDYLELAQSMRVLR